MQHPDSKDPQITIPDWLEYCNNVSCSNDNEDYFEAMVVNAYTNLKRHNLL
jgi:hypothetical protein